MYVRLIFFTNFLTPQKSVYVMGESAPASERKFASIRPWKFLCLGFELTLQWTGGNWYLRTGDIRDESMVR